MNVITDYDQRSWQHECRMRELYSKGAASDGALLQPWANACWRAAAFGWRSQEDEVAVRTLWAEAACALAEGFTRKRAGFEQSTDQLILGLHFSISAQADDVTRSLVHAQPAGPRKSRMPGRARSGQFLLAGYQAVVRSLIEDKGDHAHAAQQLLGEARLMDEREERQLSGTRAADWQFIEHEVTRALLGVIAGVLQARTASPVGIEVTDREAATRKFAGLLDAALLSLDRFIEAEVSHRPKFYCWLPGIALSVLAGSAGLSLDWLSVRAQDKQGYSRLPAKLVLQTAGLHARVGFAG